MQNYTRYSVEPKFAIEEFAPAKLNSVNLRSEVHGEKHVPAVDLSFTQDVPNTVLSYFDGALLSALYYCSAASSGQAEIEGVPQILPNLRFPKLGLPLKWEDSGKGYFLEVDYGLGPDESNIELDLCTVGEFRITPREGGTVEIKFRVQASGEQLTEKVFGKLASLIQQEVKIQLTPPKAVAGDEPDKQLPTTPDAVSKELFGDQGEEQDTPEKALERAHGGQTATTE